MPVSRMVTPVDLEVITLTCDACQQAVYMPLNPWTATGELRIHRTAAPGETTRGRFAVLPNVTEQQAVELAMRQGWQVIRWCGQRRIVCKNCTAQEARENSPIRAS